MELVVWLHAVVGRKGYAGRFAGPEDGAAAELHPDVHATTVFLGPEERGLYLAVDQSTTRGGGASGGMRMWEMFLRIAEAVTSLIKFTQGDGKGMMACCGLWS